MCKETEEFELTGQTVQNVLKSQSLLAISLNVLKNKETCENLLNDWTIKNMKIIQASDSHSSLEEYTGSGKPFGTRSCWIKMGNLTYKSLFMSFKQQNSMVYFDKPKLNKAIYMYGVAVKGGFLINTNKNKSDFCIFPFSPELNCLIGPRGTGKSTIIEIIDYIFNFENYYDEQIRFERNRSPYEMPMSEKDISRYVISRFKSAIIYINVDETIYAIYSEPKGFSTPNISLYSFQKEKGTFKKIIHCNRLNNKQISDFIRIKENFKVKVYKQKDLQEMTSSTNGIIKLIDKLNVIGLGTEYLQKKMLIQKYYKELQSLCEVMVKERWKDKNADRSTIELEKKYKEYFDAYEEYIELFRSSIENINNRLKGKLELSYDIQFDKELLYEMGKNIAIQYERINGNNYYMELKMKEDFQSFISSNINCCPDLLFLIFTHNHNEIYNRLELNKYKVSVDNIEKIVDLMWNAISQDYAPLLPQPVIDFKLNVNYEIKSNELYIERNKLSFGQKTVGALLLIMHGATELGDKIPLIIDQPEDDLDNSYVYHMLIKQFSLVKENKQLLIATHNPNIPVCGDAENILVLESDGKNGWIECYGTLDLLPVSKSVLRILEGDFEAFKRRAEVYGFELINAPTIK